MTFLLRILFTGLIAFVPSADGKEVTVLLLNVPHEQHLSDGTELAHHKPLLIARAGSCSGDCPKRDADIAAYLYNDKSLAVAQDSLEEAVGGGGAWALNGSDLSLSKGSSSAPDLPALSITRNVRPVVNGIPAIIPTTAAEREDFSWVADLKQVCPTACTFDSSMLGTTPAGIVAARLHLRSGKVFTYSVIRSGSDVTPVYFQRLDGQGNASPYTQAVAAWVGADIEVSGDDITIDESSFGGSAGRSMTLTPDSSGKMEVAVLNLPPFVPPASTSTAPPEVGKHFEMFYELDQTPPAAETRLVPFTGAAGSASFPTVDWSSIHPSSSVYSDLLNKLRLDVNRSAFERILCPPITP
jgi:hypothetical protein